MTSLNAVVIGIRLFISLFIQRLLAEIVGETGIAKIGSLRNLIQMLTSLSSVGVFNGVVKYVSEFKEDKAALTRLFSTAFVFTLLGSVLSSVALLIWSAPISEHLFNDSSFAYLIKIVAVIVPFIAMQRVFNGIVNGLSKYKSFSKIELIAYLIGSALTVGLLILHGIDGALVAIAVIPAIQLLTLFYVFLKVLREYMSFKDIRFKAPMAKALLAFSLMSFVSTVLFNFVEIDIRRMITAKITESDAGVWTAMTNISKNYMVFSGALFGLYVLPRFASISKKKDFMNELGTIYKTLLPIFGLGMILIYFLKDYVIALIYPDFTGMAPLFKWQLLGDFIKLASMVLAYQFVAKKMVRNFIFTELLSLGLFYAFAKAFTTQYGLEGVVMAHFLRYAIYFVVVIFLVWRYFNKQKNTNIG